MQIEFQNKKTLFIITVVSIKQSLRVAGFREAGLHGGVETERVRVGTKSEDDPETLNFTKNRKERFIPITPIFAVSIFLERAEPAEKG